MVKKPHNNSKSLVIKYTADGKPVTPT